VKFFITSIFIFVFGFLIGDIESRTIKNIIKDYMNNLISSEENIKIIKANSFKVEIEKFETLYPEKNDYSESTTRSAGFYLDDNKQDLDYKVYLQDGQILNRSYKDKIILPEKTEYEFNGGLKNIFFIKKKPYGLVSMVDSNCYYLSLIELETKKSLISGKCLLIDDTPDFNGSGGAYVHDNENLYLSIGIPVFFGDDDMDILAQDKKSIYGKILKIKKEKLSPKIEYQTYTVGHRNPQGLAKVGEEMFSTEHGPQGGDEINLIIENMNYEWPYRSLGTRYGDGKSYKSDIIIDNLKSPIYSFIPSIAPSSLASCPEKIKLFYQKNICLVSLSLRAQSLYIFLIDKQNKSLVNYEQIKIGKRLRHFGLDYNGNLFNDKGSFYVITDDLEILKITFKNFR